MSLSSFLLGDVAKSKGKGKAIDTALDDLFRTSTVTVAQTSKSNQAESSKPVVPEKKRKAAPEVTSAAKTSKRSKSEHAATPSSPIKPASTVASKATHKKPKARKQPEPESSEEEDEDEEGVEEKDDLSEEEEASVREVPDESEDSGSDDEGDPTKLVHETVSGAKGPKPAKRKTVPSDETPEQRDLRTIFVGNVPVDVVKSKPLQKQFKRHILTFVPSAKIESVRFRSVAFAKPTAQLPTDDPSSSKSAPQTKTKEPRQHDRERTATWRDSKGQREAAEEAAADAGKTFLTPKEKKRIAFIKQEIHTGVDSVNAYVVFAHPPPTENRPKNLPPLEPVMDPYEAAKIAIKEADGSVFAERTIRVDTAVKSKEKKLELADGDIAGDPKATVFVGNLDFASKEEDVRAFFESVMVKERGQPGAAQSHAAESEDEDEDNDDSASENDVEKVAATPKQKAWVKRVRIIRDKDTQLGKGFGYVQFTDRSCVDEILALEEGNLKFAKRKLRVQRCKTLPGAAKSTKIASSKRAPKSQDDKNGRPAAPQRRRISTEPAPKGDPMLGTKIASLSKEERKKVKASDADRVARRLAKKKAKVLADKGVKSIGGKERERVRKKPKDGLKNPGSKDNAKKRVRSNKALSKLNTKK